MQQDCEFCQSIFLDYVENYEYDSIGQLTSMKDPAGVTTHYGYDLLGRTSRISSDQGMEVEYAYDCLGRVEKITYGNGVETSYQYDAYGNLSSLSTRAGGTDLLSFTYAYDGNGNRTVKTGIQGPLTNGSNALDISYRYNVRGQLLEERRNGAPVCYAYDAAGNRIRKTDAQGEAAYQYDKNNRILLEKGTKGIKKFTYDAQGGILEEKSAAGVRRSAYNSKHQQTRVETGDGQVQENRYDAEGLRFELLENGKRTRFVYHQGELLHEEGGDESQGSYHLGTGIEALRRDGEYYYYHQDEQRSTALITDQTGEVQNYYQYDAFGVELEKIEQLSNRIRYTGQQYDSLTEQYYLRARYYNPVLGRFMQEDVYQGDGLNLYAYCDNNPVMYYDPSGYGKNNPQQNPYEKAKNNGDGSQGEGGSGTKDIYRAVSPEEYDDILATNGFRAREDGLSMKAKEFGNSFDETLDFANQPINSDKAAIIKVTISEETYNQLNHMNLDSVIFKSGTPVVEPEMLAMFNQGIKSIEHVF